jgi:hypothetical protein
MANITKAGSTIGSSAQTNYLTTTEKCSVGAKGLESSTMHGTVGRSIVGRCLGRLHIGWSDQETHGAAPEAICTEWFDKYMENIPEFVAMLEDYEKNEGDPE